MNEQSPYIPTFVDRGGSQSDLRRFNERVVLSALRRYPGLFNAELSRRTGLAAQTISVILRSLEEQRLIRRGEVLRGRRGQPATPIYLNPQGAYAFGCSLGWRQFDLVLCDLEGKIVVEESWQYAFPDPDEMLEQIVQSVDRFLDRLPSKARNRALRFGLALPSVGVGEEGVKGVPEEVAAAWRAHDAADALSLRLGMPVREIGDGAAACGAENRQIMAAHCADFGYLHLGHTLSGGVVLGGRLFTGRDGKAPDLGAMVICTRDGPHARATDVAGSGELEAQLGAAGVEVPLSIGRDWEWQNAGVALENWIEDAGHALAQVVHNVQSVLDCGTFVIDGTLPASLIKAVIAQTEVAMVDHPAPPGGPVRLIQGQLGASAAAMGAADLVLFETFFAYDPQG
ncbi:ROK family transcriptional regulator [Pelagibacterium xiamenense]|uniref:ROK family transcriptional regulator n=1 Tax=Pelagibacterium xiamenense TaxID=2901140 RepID=UPI001E422130|nr:ROK family transcriptional regulator [Pelagibacterium xiamenense]MCD7061344.1 ROK family transcriptional regulator [Pelagibacterium xiamenense]